MFLFTTPAGPPEIPDPPALVRPAPAPVVQAIRDGASATGVGFDYLLSTARRESALDPSAKAATSSATGLFQFIEQTWLGTLKNAGPQLGLQAQADAIVRQADGTYAVPDAGQRQAILDLRRDPKVAAVLAGALTQKNAQTLQATLGREPTAGDLYAAHVLGAKGAASLIATAQTFPERAAALDLPEAAAANRALFYDRSGRPRTAADLYASLAAAANAGPATGPAARQDTRQDARQDARQDTRQDGTDLPSAASAYAATAAAFGGSADLRSLFQTDRRGTVSDAAARLWQGRTAPPVAVRPAPSYFPRSDGLEQESPAAFVASADPAYAPEITGALPPVPPGLALVNAPLPPRRPAEFAAGPSAASPFAVSRRVP